MAVKNVVISDLAVVPCFMLGVKQTVKSKLCLRIFQEIVNGLIIQQKMLWVWPPSRCSDES